MFVAGVTGKEREKGWRSSSAGRNKGKRFTKEEDEEAGGRRSGQEKETGNRFAVEYRKYSRRTSVFVCGRERESKD